MGDPINECCLPWRTVKSQIVLILIAVSLFGCGRDVEPNSIVLWDTEYELKSLMRSTPVDLSGVRFLGYRDASERTAIALCLGRISAANLYMKEIAVVWPENRVAARVTLDRGAHTKYVLFLVRDRMNSWRIQGSCALLVN